MENFWFQNNQYCNVQNMQKVIVGCWKCDSDKILVLYTKNKSIIWIDRWTHWTTRWQPAQFRRVMRCPWNHTWIDGSPVLTSRTANLEMGHFRPVPGPKGPVLNCCSHYTGNEEAGRPLATLFRTQGNPKRFQPKLEVNTIDSDWQSNFHISSVNEEMS